MRERERGQVGEEAGGVKAYPWQLNALFILAHSTSLFLPADSTSLSWYLSDPTILLTEHAHLRQAYHYFDRTWQ